MRCSTCWKDLETDIGDMVHNQWLKLMNYFEHEYTEGEITEQTYNSMADALMAVEPIEKVSNEPETEE